ncbi:hypothetical protein [Streptacidiphilus sp. MAP5-3]|uniref:hypothetical protein n=1 Tax=unclassified Streptacidiphilus TaxID=2643834 RepID=UPI003517BCE8
MSPLEITGGGLLVAACLLVAVGFSWWRKGSGGGRKGTASQDEGGGGRSWRTLVAPILCLSLGIVCATDVGGGIGKGGRLATKGSNQLGNDALHTLAGATTQTATHAAPAPLPEGAAIIVVLGLLLFGLAMRRAAKQRRRDLGFSLLAGLALGPAAFALQFAHSVVVPALTTGGNLIMGNM